MSDRYEIVAPGRPTIIDGRYYLCRREPPVVILDQPRMGFANVREAEAFLAGKVNMDWPRGQQFAIAEAAQIDDETKARQVAREC